MSKARFLFILLIFTLSLTACNRDKILEDEDGIIKTTLENGLTVIIKENHTSPIVTILTNVKVGYLDESDAQSGISHLLEHMYFKGTEKRPKPADIWKAARMNGGS